jgi:hypothetical protein
LTSSQNIFPTFLVQETGNRYEVLDRLDTEIARLVGTLHSKTDSAIPAAACVFAVASAGGAPRKASRITMLTGKPFASLR